MSFSHPSLEGRCVIVTGGSRGLGRAMTLALMEAGARTGIVATGDSAPLRETLAQAAARKGEQPLVALGDLRNPDDCARMARELIEGLGRVDALINNAGVPNVGPGAPFWKLDADYWLRMAHSNTDGIFFLTKELAPAMIERGFGRIVNISTGDRTMVRKNLAPYGPSKAFVEAASRIFAQDLAGTGVTVNVLLPGGAVDTIADVTGQQTQGKTFLAPDVMNDALLWLVSDLSNGHSGERFACNLWDESSPLAQRIANARQCGARRPGHNVNVGVLVSVTPLVARSDC
ncbi:MAG: SDR family oxidoreductase [Beijerinckiaceae bacterium]|nr:SDR family oxidoreductase [Beijerinckiaceae bacterium]